MYRLWFFAVTLAAYQQQQQQRSMAVGNLIMDDYDDDTELDAENDESSRGIKRLMIVDHEVVEFIPCELETETTVRNQSLKQDRKQ